MRVERFAGGNPGHLPFEPGAAQGTRRGGMKGIGCGIDYCIHRLRYTVIYGCGLHHQDLDGLELSRRDRRRHRRWIHGVNGLRNNVA